MWPIVHKKLDGNPAETLPPIFGNKNGADFRPRRYSDTP
jgi:hypothetical protein